MNYRKNLMTVILTGTMLISSMPGSVFAENKNDELIGTLAFAKCEEYINVRSSADQEGEVVGKIYNHCAATILGEKDGWYEIKSGNATGYVSSQYFVTGEAAEKLAPEVSYQVAEVFPEHLNVRATPSDDADIVDTAVGAQELEMVGQDGNWTKVAMGNGVYGYVSSDYVAHHTYYATAETLEEEQSRIAEKQAAAEAAYAEETAYNDAQAAADTANQEYIDAQAAADAEYQAYLDAQAAADAYYEEAYTDENGEYVENGYYDETGYNDAQAAADAEYQSYLDAQAAADQAYEQQQVAQEQADASYTENSGADNVYGETAGEVYEDTYVDANSGLGQQIVDFALQFVGNPYVYGGTSLTNGTDCSGFTMSVFGSFGIGLARTAADQAGNGYAVDAASAQPGDLFFYSEGGGISHVAIYIGGGQIVHASTEATGIRVSDAYYSTPVCVRRCV